METAIDTDIDFIARSLLGSTRLRRVSYEIDSIPVITRDVASRLLGREIAIAAFDSSVTELFSVTHLASPVIVYSSHYLEIVAALRWLHWIDLPDQDVVNVSRSLFLEVLGEKVARRGLKDVGTRLFLESWGGSTPRFKTRSTLSDSDLKPSLPNESSLLISIGFQLAHEAGHFFAESNPTIRNRLIPIIAHRLNEAIRAIAELQPYEANIDQLSAFVCSDPTSPVTPPHIADEVMADGFAITVVHQLLADTAGDGDVLAINAAAMEIVIQIISTSWLERVEAMNHRWHDSQLPLERDALRYRSATILVRLSFLRDHFYEAFALPGLLSEQPDMKRKLRRIIDGAVEILRPRAHLIGQGVELAIDFVESTVTHEEDIKRLGEAAVLAVTQPDFVRDARAYCDGFDNAGSLLTSALRNLVV